MGTRPKHHSWDYISGLGSVPFFVGDRWYGQDILRDFQFLEDLTGRSLTDLTNSLPILLKGGVCSKGTGDSLNITAPLGYHEKTITVPNTYSTLPPSLTTAQKIVRAAGTMQTNLAIPSATLDGSTVNYVKLAYLESDGNSRVRAKSGGTYVYEKIPSFVITVDTIAPTSEEILLSQFVGPTGGPYVFTQGNLSPNDFLNFGAFPHLQQLRDEARRGAD